jgi:hypothetical protein
MKEETFFFEKKEKVQSDDDWHILGIRSMKKGVDVDFSVFLTS